jgi:hypothetical protein
MRVNLTLLISLLLLASLAIAELPQMSYHDNPAVIPIHNLDAACAKDMAADHPELAKEARKPMADLGYLSSEPRTEVQDANATSLENFTQTIPPIPASVGNMTGNVTEINDTLVWW